MSYEWESDNAAFRWFENHQLVIMWWVRSYRVLAAHLAPFSLIFDILYSARDAVVAIVKC